MMLEDIYRGIDNLIVRSMMLSGNLLVSLPFVIPLWIVLLFIWPYMAYILFVGWITCFVSFLVFGLLLTAYTSMHKGRPRNGCRTRTPVYSQRFDL